MRMRHRHRVITTAILALLLAAVTACSSGGGKTLFIGGIPDQDASVLQERFDGLADYLSGETGLKVKYLPSTSYAAVVTGFKQGSIQLAWFGGLTGVQARLAVPNAQAIAQRSTDESFRSVFIARKGSGIASLEDLKGKTITFGSESSTSGYLMPLFYITEAGLDPDRDLDAVNFSGSHDKTWKLVEAGAFEAGALNANVWRDRVGKGDVDLDKVEVFWTTPAYFDYHWVLSGDVDEKFGDGAAARLRDALLKIDAASAGEQQRIMEAFQAERFIEADNDDYEAIERVARRLDIIK